MNGRNVRVRPAAVAGAFYPGDAPTLAATVDGLLTEAAVHQSRSAHGRLRALVVPHAGYVYSGPVAASAYTLLRANASQFARAVILGPAHRVALRGVAVTSADELDTPLGRVTVDAEARRRVLGIPNVVVDDGAHALEHSVEVQLPFLQRIAPNLPVLPLVVGAASRDAVRALIEVVWDDDTLVIASTDLSHYLDYATARAVDTRTAANVVAEDADSIDDYDACGAYGLRPLLDVARSRRLRVDQLDLRSSGDTAGPRDRVVGYGAFAIEAAA